MDLNLDNFQIRRTNPYIAGSTALLPGEQRYMAKAEGLIGFEIFEGDTISIINIEGQQVCEIVSFDKDGKNELGIIDRQKNANAKFIKYILTNSPGETNINTITFNALIFSLSGLSMLILLIRQKKDI